MPVCDTGCVGWAEGVGPCLCLWCWVVMHRCRVILLRWRIRYHGVALGVSTLPCVLARDARVFSQGIVDSEVAGVVAHAMPLLVGRGMRAPIWPCMSHQGKELRIRLSDHILMQQSYCAGVSCRVVRLSPCARCRLRSFGQLRVNSPHMTDKIVSIEAPSPQDRT